VQAGFRHLHEAGLAGAPSTAASFTATMLAAVCGPRLLTAFLAVPLIGWSRVVLGDHDRVQVIGGTLLGVAALVIFLPLN
jgi:membrane-associated phospholipid phosphatase